LKKQGRAAPLGSIPPATTASAAPVTVARRLKKLVDPAPWAGSAPARIA